MFWKKDKKNKEDNKKPEEFGNIDKEKDDETNSRHVLGLARGLPKASDISKVRNFEFGILKGFYVSEKASTLNSLNQYVFKVFDGTTKNEIKKQVETNFDVRVGGVKIINLPKKKRSVGRHSGFKKGFKKAIVTLKEGYSIDQAKV